MPRGPQSATIRPLQAPASPLISLFTPPRSTIRGVETTDWFGPLQPVKPFAPQGTEPRSFQYNPGQNLVYTPRADRVYKAEDLRRLARYPLAQMCISNVCDMVCRMPITVRLKRLADEKASDHKARTKNDKLLPRLQDLVDYPNPEQTRQDFVREVLTDYMVGDWASILIRRTKNGQVQELRVPDGAMTTRYITEQGYTPTPQEGPAYAQVWNGMVLADLTTDQLIYAMRNRKRDGLYGFSPTEQIAEEIEIGIQRLSFVLQFYTAGSIPDAIQLAPMGVDKDTVKEAQDWLEASLAGQLAKRSGIRLIQSLFTAKDWPTGEQMLFPKAKELSDDFDDRHLRKIAFAYGASPQRLLKTLNRASAGANQEAAEEEGTMPVIDFLETRIYNWLFQRTMKLPGYEISIDADNETDPLKQAQTSEINTGKAMMTINEDRALRGQDPRPEKEASMLGVVTATGWVPIDAEEAAARAGAVAQASFVPGQQDDEDPKGGKKPKPTNNKPKPKKAWAY